MTLCLPEHIEWCQRNVVNLVIIRTRVSATIFSVSFFFFFSRQKRSWCGDRFVLSALHPGYCYYVADLAAETFFT